MHFVLSVASCASFSSWWCAASMPALVAVIAFHSLRSGEWPFSISWLTSTSLSRRSACGLFATCRVRVSVLLLVIIV